MRLLTGKRPSSSSSRTTEIHPHGSKLGFGSFVLTWSTASGKGLTWVCSHIGGTWSAVWISTNNHPWPYKCRDAKQRMQPAAKAVLKPSFVLDTKALPRSKPNAPFVGDFWSPYFARELPAPADGHSNSAAWFAERWHPPGLRAALQTQLGTDRAVPTFLSPLNPPAGPLASSCH